VVPALLAGAFAIAAASFAYALSLRRARADLDDRIRDQRLSVFESAASAEAEYRLETEKTFLAGVGPASGQVIETVHDLTDRLSALFDTITADPAQMCTDWHCRQTLIWQMIRPLAWIEVLRRRRSRLDQTLNTAAVRNHHRFLTACHFYEWSFSSLRIFDGIDYDPSKGTAHLFYSTIQLAADATVVTEDESQRCMSYAEFLAKFGEFRYTWLGAFDDLLAGTAEESDIADLRRVRLLTVYVACCSIRRHFPIPYRPPPEAPVIVNLRWVRNPVLRDRVQEQLTAWLGCYETRIRGDPRLRE
jgi:hypothetical protein